MAGMGRKVSCRLGMRLIARPARTPACPQSHGPLGVYSAKKKPRQREGLPARLVLYHRRDNQQSIAQKKPRLLAKPVRRGDCPMPVKALVKA